jgi:hypothetical protein
MMFEGGSSHGTDSEVRAVGELVKARASEGKRMWGGSDICDVVFHRAKGVCQFSFACLPAARRTPRQSEIWQRMLSMARDVLDGVEAQDMLARYYLNPQETSDRNVCRFKREFVPVFTEGRHDYYRPPEKSEVQSVRNGIYPECIRYQAALQRAKLAAAAKKKRLALKRKGKKRFAHHSGRRYAGR